MKFTIERTVLLKALSHVQSVVERRNTIPILSNVLLEADDGKLSLTATDMDITIVETIDADIAQAGATTAPAHTLHDIARKLPDGAQATLELNGETGQIELSAGRSRFSLQSLPREDFPTMGGDEFPHRFTVPGAMVKQLIDRTRFSISTEETRYYLNGIYLHAAKGDSGDVLRAVATDGHRLARVEAGLPDGAAGMPGVIVPRKTVLELHKLVDESEGDIEIALSETKIEFSLDNLILTSKLIDGTFPDYERVIPAANDKVMTVDCKVFSEAVDRVSIISTEKSRAVKLAASGSTLVLSVNSPDAGSATEEVEVEYGGDLLEIGFNSRYLLDITQQLDGGTAEFTMADAASPTIIRDTEDAGALYVLMPMRV
ncbi:MAG: DNA polymerase III subunit beta [Pseudomonadota bacterium]